MSVYIDEIVLFLYTSDSDVQLDELAMLNRRINDRIEMYMHFFLGVYIFFAFVHYANSTNVFEA